MEWWAIYQCDAGNEGETLPSRGLGWMKLGMAQSFSF